MPGPALPFRLELHPEAARRVNAAFGKTTADGEPKETRSTLLGHEKRTTSANILNGRTKPSPEVLGTSAMRFSQAADCNLIVALASLFAIVNVETGEVITFDDSLKDLLKEVADYADHEPIATAP